VSAHVLCASWACGGGPFICSSSLNAAVQAYTQQVDLRKSVGSRRLPTAAVHPLHLVSMLTHACVYAIWQCLQLARVPGT
jgi:hypothetical protein